MITRKSKKIFFSPKKCTESVKTVFVCVATLACSLSMPGCQVGGDPAEIGHTHSVLLYRDTRAPTNSRPLL